MKETLLNYSKTTYPFHMPGHKLGRISPLGGVDLYGLDVTEVEGTDNLHQPEGIIKEAAERARRLYGSEHTFILVNGSSSGVLSAVSACCQQDSQILMARNSHKSIYHSVFMNRLDPIYIYPEYIEAFGVFGGICPERVEAALQKNPQISCVILTSPTFEGFTSDIKSISDIVHRYGKVLIIDEAHGAHFPFHPVFPRSALMEGADIVTQSVHKTLPAFTQSALLHVKSDLVDLEKLKMYLSIYQTTSPSYILMTGVDACLRWLETEGKKAFEDWVKELTGFRDSIRDLTHFSLLGRELIGQYGIQDMDLSRLVFVGKKGNINGKKVDTLLREAYHIQVEMATLGSIVAISTVADGYEGYTLLKEAFYAIDQKNDYINHQKFDIISESTKDFNPYTAYCREKEIINYRDSFNRISGQYITLYPPGIPIVAPGERVTGEIICTLTQYLQNGLTVIGLDGQKISVLREV